MSRHWAWEPQNSGFTPEQLRVRAETEAAHALAQEVHDLRVELGLTRADFARRAGVDEREITSIEDGPHVPDITTLLRLDEVFGLSVPSARSNADHPDSREDWRP